MFDCSKEITGYHDDKVTLPLSERTEMRDRRNSNRDRVKNGLKEKGDPAAEEFVKQGSYAMKTMVQHKEKDYDIDDGVYFAKEDLKGSQGAYKTALDARQMVRDAVDDGGFKTAPAVRKNCVRVYYEKGYHVDLPVYRHVEEKDALGNTESYYELASSDWKRSDARDVTDWFDKENRDQSPDETNGRQLRRITRLVKKFSQSRESWKGKIASGFMITKLVTEKYLKNQDREDSSLYDTMKAIHDRLETDLVVKHPVTPDSTITSGDTDPKAKFLKERLSEVLTDLDVLFDGECTREKAIKAWDKVFNTTYFSDKFGSDDGKKANAAGGGGLVSGSGGSSSPSSAVKKMAAADMPRSLSLAKSQFDRAVSELEDSILKELAARRLSLAEMEGLYKDGRFAAGWQFEKSVDGKNVGLNLLLPFDFPFAPPSFGFASPPNLFTYPHVERNGTLCLLSSASSVDPARPAGVVRELLDDAIDLLERSFSKTNRDDFRKEFLSYWDKAGTASTVKFVSLLHPDRPSRLVRIWHGTTSSFIAENEAELVSWLKKQKPNQKFNTSPAAVLWLNHAMLPEQYPKSTAGLLNTVRELGSVEAMLVLRSLVATAPDRAEILLATRSASGIFYAGVTLYKPDGSHSRYASISSPLTKGFRKGRVPATIVADRYLNANQPVKRHYVDRADHAWIHGRDVDSGQFSLADKHVVILGCGSVGGPVAKLLATAGVGKLTCVDPESLSWANVGRHYLGGLYVGGNKASRLAEELQQNYPHLEFDARPVSWESLAEEDVNTIKDADLIISTMGTWSSEGLLNHWQRENQGPPIVYGWTENFATAGHAVAILSDGPCFQCQLSEHGEPRVSVTRWPGSTLKQEAACGVMFQPYGPIEVSYTCNIVAEHVVDVLMGKVDSSVEKIWAARESLVRENGGDWTAEWLALAAGNTKGGFLLERPWERRADCPVCKRAMTAC